MGYVRVNKIGKRKGGDLRSQGIENKNVSMESVISQFIPVNEEDLESLDFIDTGKSQKAWLNSTVIDAYLAVLAIGREDTLILSAETRTYPFEEMERYSQTIIPSFAFRHWSLIHIVEKEAWYFNSQSSAGVTSGYDDEVLGPLRKRGYKIHIVKASQQCNGNDCGVYTCFFAKCILGSSKPGYTSDDEGEVVPGGTCRLTCPNAKFFRNEIKNTILENLKQIAHGDDFED